MTSKDVEMVEDDKLRAAHDSEEGNYNCTYSFNGEDHTLGNLLRYVLMKDPETLFSGYSVPHPSEDVMNVRLQTHTMKTDRVLNKAFGRISKMCDILTDKYTSALNDYDQENN